MHTTSRPSLVSDLAESIRRDLQAGEWQDFLPSERALGDRLQVSRPTLRKALNLLAQQGWVKSRKGLGWRVVRASTKRTRSRASGSVGILCFVPLDEASGFNMYAIDKLQDHLHNAGVSVHVHAGTQYMSQNFRPALERLVRGSPASNWLLVGSAPAAACWFQERNLPICISLTYRKTEPAPSVRVDMESAYRHAVGQLVRRGHRRIALVLPNPVRAAVKPMEQDETIQNWEKSVALCRAGMEITDRIVLHNRMRESLRSALRALFAKPAPPTALVVVRPQHALAALTHLTASGIRVPQDVSVISMGYETYLDHVQPSLACYKLDRKSYARKLCRLVLPWVRIGYWPSGEHVLLLQFHGGESLSAAP